MNLETMNRKVEEDEQLQVDIAWFIAYRYRFLVLFVVGDDRKTMVENRVKEIFPHEFRPSRIIFLDSFPLNRSGKIDETALRARLDSIYHASAFESILGERLPVEWSENCDLSFVDIGVDSLLAAELSACCDVAISGQVMIDMLDPKMSIRKFWEKWAGELNRKRVDEKSAACPPRIRLKTRARRQPAMKWAHDLKKCIDGNPLVIRNRVFAASHSGIVKCVDLQSGTRIWQAHLPTRFECSPVQIDEDIVLGGYNGIVYRIRSEDGTIRWSFETGDQIKADCLAQLDLAIYCVSYDGNLYKLEANTGHLIWKTSIGGGSPASPCLLANSSAILVTTIIGNILKIDVETGQVLWRRTTKMPIFSTPLVFREDYFLLAMVNGQIQCRRIDCGEIKSRIDTDCRIFCAPAMLNESIGYVAAQNGIIVEMAIDERENMRISRIFEFDSPTISFVRTPRIEKSANRMSVMSTDARFIQIDLLASRVEMCIEVSNGNVFSMPQMIDDDRIICCTRDDWLRCFQL